MRRFLSLLALGLAVGGAALAMTTLRPDPAEPEPTPLPEAQLPKPVPPPVEGERRLDVRITPEMIRYSNQRYAIYFGSALYYAVALLALLYSGVSARLRDFAEQRARHPLARAFIYYPLLALSVALLRLPLSFYSSYALPHHYGLSNQSLGGWAADQAKSLGLSAVIGAPILALVFWTLRRSPRRWWLGFWLASIPLLIFAVLLAPIVVDPLFNRFGPLRDTALRDRILSLARQAGIEHGRVFEVDASVRTKQVNAYVTGLGGTTRIVLWDTLLERFEEDEVLFVMAHEMGHYVHRHVLLGVLLSIGGTLGMLWITDRGYRALLQRHKERWRLRGPDDLAATPVLLLLLLLLNFFGSPVESAISRTMERDADQFALRLTDDTDTAVSAYIKLSELNLSHPNPPAFVEWWMFSHPPLAERIATARNRQHPSAPALPTPQE